MPYPLNIAPISKAAHVFRALQVGQVVRMQLVETQKNGGIVSLEGRLYRAGGTLPARPCTNFWAVVEQISGDAVRVRHIQPVDPSNNQVNTSDLAQALALPQKKEINRTIAELLRLQLPLDRDFILRTAAFCRGLSGEQQEAVIRALTWLQSQQLPSQTNALSKILAYLMDWPSATPEGQALLNQAQPYAGREPAQVLEINGGDRLQGRLYLLGGFEQSEDSNRRRLVLQLKSELLGEFWVCLDLWKQSLSGAIYTKEQTTAAYFKEMCTCLIERLRNLGYIVDSFEVRRRSFTTIADFVTGDDHSESIAYVSLDVRI